MNSFNISQLILGSDLSREDLRTILNAINQRMDALEDAIESIRAANDEQVIDTRDPRSKPQ